MKAIEIIGLGCGNEGKAKITDFLSLDAKYVIRDNNTVNERHTVYLNNDVVKTFTHLPSGFGNAIKIITNNVFIDLVQINKLIEEEQLTPEQLKISFDCFFYLPWHLQAKDSRAELRRDIISGEALLLKDLYRANFLNVLKNILKNKNKVLVENGKDTIKAIPLYEQINLYATKLRPYLCDTNLLVANLENNDKIIIEGANSVLPYFLPDTQSFIEMSNLKGVNKKIVTETIGVIKTFISSKTPISLPTKVVNETKLNHFLNNGEEYSVKTKTYNHIYWLDTVLLRYLIKVNGISKIALTFLDTLSGLSKIKVCKSYNYKGCELIDYPSELTSLEEVVPNYVELTGWNSDLSKVRKLKDMPKTVLKFVKNLEMLLECEISIISFGKTRAHTLELKGI